MKSEIYIVETVIQLGPNGIQPVGFSFGGVFSAIGSGISKVGSSIGSVLGSASSKLGVLFKSPVMGKLLEAGVSIGGGLLVGSVAAKSQEKIAKMQIDSANKATEQVQQQIAAQNAAASGGTTTASNTTKYLLYGGAGLAALVVVYLVMNRSKKR
jgi:hypothetical protein